MPIRWKPLRWMSSFPAWFTSLLLFSAGIIFWGGFNWSMELSNTETFCISCHEMEQNVYREYRKTGHYTNPTGVRATCPDCHVPRDWIHKVVRKVGATNELYHWLIGSIDTRKKFLARRYELAGFVWKAMKDTDSRECRNCHGNDYMALDKQSLMAKKMHELGFAWGKTCIDCHQGVAHTLPAEFDKEKRNDQLHRRLEREGVKCFECHENLYTPSQDLGW